MKNIKINEIMSLLASMYSHFSIRRRFQLKLLVVLTLFGSIAEIISLGSVVPFIAVLTQPEVIFEYPFISDLMTFFDITESGELVVILAIIFMTAAVVSGSMRLLLLWATIKIVNGIGADLSISVYRKSLYQPYASHISRNSSTIITVVTQKVNAITGVLMSTVTAITSLVLLLAILGTLILIDPMISIVAILSFGFCYASIILMTRKKVFVNGQDIAIEQTNIVKLIQEGVGAIRDILIDRNQEMYISLYGKSIRDLQHKNSSNAFIIQSPRYALESFGMVLIGGLVLLLNDLPAGIGGALPTLAALGLGAQRMLPLLQQIYGNWMIVIGRSAAMVDAFDILDQTLPEIPLLAHEPTFKFNNEIIFKGVCFRYSESMPWVLKDVNLTIEKGSRVGIIGSTGGGKSTALDLLLGLLVPVKGDISIDGNSIVDDDIQLRAWHNKISHVPQNIYLVDSTLTNNIAFGVPQNEIDFDRVKLAAFQANLSTFIESCPNGYDTQVGEHGVMLSGGQCQRIGIARALYKESEIIIFDEATSSLDTKTEEKIMNCIYGLSKSITIIMIAHRITTLKNCDWVIKIENCEVAWQGPFDKIEQ